MTEPRRNLCERRRGAESPDRAKQFVLRVECERSEASLDVGPEALDGIQLWAVGREVEREAAGIEDRLANDLHLVDAEVVHDDDVAGVDPGREALLHEPEEGSSVDRASTRHDLRLLA